jgi:hypothetical protein
MRDSHLTLGSSVLLIVSLLLTGALGVVPDRTAAVDGDKVIFSLPVGDPIPYEGTGSEQLPWGPAAIAVSDDGSIWIGDGVNRRLLRFDQAGVVTMKIDLGDSFVGIGDVETFAEAIVVLDIAALDPRVDVFDQASGLRTQSFKIPDTADLDDGLSGVAVMADGTVVAELEGGAHLVPLGVIGKADQPATELAKSDAYVTELASIHLETDTPLEEGSHSRAAIDDAWIEFDVANQPGTVLLAGVSDDTIFFAVDEVSQTSDGTLFVDTTIRSYNADGLYLGQTRVPRADMLIQLFEPVGISQTGEALALIPKVDAIDVVRLAFEPHLEPVLPPIAAVEETDEAGGDAVIEACVSRTTMGNTDWGYRNDNEYLSNTNINGTCTGRVKPGYLGAAGAYPSVPYEWGGFNTVAQYDAQMSPGTGKAGNISDDHGDLSCAFGVDCSGFVSRVWQRTTKYSTSTLPNISFAIARSSMLGYDLFNKVGNHSMMHRYRSGNGYYVSESTTSGYDRVVYRWITDSYANTFTTRRFNSVCS